MDNLIFTSESVILYERKRIHALKYEGKGIKGGNSAKPRNQLLSY